MKIILAGFTTTEQENILGKAMMLYLRRGDQSNGLHIYVEDTDNE